MIRLLMASSLCLSLLACAPKKDIANNAKAADTFPELVFPPAETVYGVETPAGYVETILDQNPNPRDGAPKFLQTLYSNIRYPSAARERGVQGTMQVSIVLNEMGMIESYSVSKGIGAGCDEAALSALQACLDMPFEPAIKDGKPVKVMFDIPVRFSLQ